MRNRRVTARIDSPKGSIAAGMLTSASAQFLKPGAELGKYRIIGVAGCGGMGVVYEAKDPTIGRTVAIKALQLPPSFPVEKRDAFVSLFRQEARAAGNLSHPNIVTIYSVETVEELDFIVMEFVPGPTLKEELAQGGALAMERALTLGMQLCAALSHAHQRGVIHRDIKPGNIFLFEQNQCKLGDFGIARIEEDSETSPRRRYRNMGSLGYMSPEQMLRKPVDNRTDIFSLGVTLNEMLRGTPTFKDIPREQIVHAIRTRTFQTPGGLPPDLERCLLKAMAFEPEDRYQTADELAQGLAAVQTALEAERQGLVSRDPEAQRKMRLIHKTSCGYHPTLPAVDFCTVCGKAICVTCLQMYRGQPHCYRCRRIPTFVRIANWLTKSNLVYYGVAASLVLAIILALLSLR